ncbi:FSH1-domain-containing protein [Hyphopichia burtonii NRRL Y-1933]|uniref:FSH1-domain-containing protein n=1 Tax=Hyphopichia burtonii NRRL Y-1933 TaxID=984485 RepID=A0A1E4RHC9_9ASCO|nr:FSH1-domain-containing protein [Hyphopichia burtonii NRRL Y-1933]ODV66677.1 FSH1-domain-containing protein [Hyphopichia burtonii NRRL Y-1933]
MSVTRRILCLPGYLQNGKVFAEKSSGIRKLLTKKLGFELDYVDPPIKINTKEELPFKLGETEEEQASKWDAIVEQDLNRCWWVHKDPGTYEGFDEALNYVIEQIKTKGPYDGIIGFSQGAAMAAIVTNKVKELVPNHEHFKIGVFFSGFVFTEPVNSEDIMVNLNHSIENVKEYQEKVKVVPEFVDRFTLPKCETRILNIYGSSDNTVPGIRSEYLSTFYPQEQLQEFKHEGGHFLPNKKNFLNPIIEVFKEVFDIKSNL